MILDGLIILWVPSDLPPSNFGEESAEEMGDKEFWRDKRAIKYVFIILNNLLNRTELSSFLQPTASQSRKSTISPGVRMESTLLQEARTTLLRCFRLPMVSPASARVESATDRSRPSGSCVHQIQDHAHYVQGVAWDPLNEYLATQSSDR